MSASVTCVDSVRRRRFIAELVRWMQQCPLLLHDRDAIHLKKVRKEGGAGRPGQLGDPPAGRGNKEDIQLRSNTLKSGPMYRWGLSPID